MALSEARAVGTFMGKDFSYLCSERTTLHGKEKRQTLHSSNMADIILIKQSTSVLPGANHADMPRTLSLGY